MKNTLMNGGHAAPGWIYSAAEHHLYGSSRLGVHQTNLVLASRDNQDPIVYTVEETEYTTFTRGKRNYELSNHLGNVQVVVSDKRISVCDEYLGVERFKAEVLSAVDYYPFGMMMPDRQYYASNDSSNYRFGFNGMEHDDEISGQGNNLDFGARIYDSRLGRWLSVDPFSQEYPFFTPYQFANNDPIETIDSKGLEGENYIENWYDKVGYPLFKLATEKQGFSVIGAIQIIAHANIERGWGEKTNSVNKSAGWKTNNWWNFAPLENKGQSTCQGGGRWACFPTLEEGFAGYIDRITSEPDLIEYHNDNFNPSYPKLGELFKKDRPATEAEILDATRTKTFNGHVGVAGDYAYDPGNLDYGKALVKATKQAAGHLLDYVNLQLQKNQTKSNELWEDYKKSVDADGFSIIAFGDYMSKALELAKEKTSLDEIKKKVEEAKNKINEN